MVESTLNLEWLIFEDKFWIPEWLIIEDGGSNFTESIVGIKILKTYSTFKEPLDIWQHCHLYSQLATLDLPTSGGPN